MKKPSKCYTCYGMCYCDYTLMRYVVTMKQSSTHLQVNQFWSISKLYKKYEDKVHWTHKLLWNTKHALNCSNEPKKLASNALDASWIVLLTPST
jgi:hypothetical protein